MTTVDDLGFEEIARRLRGPGLTITCGAFVTRFTSRLDAVARGVHENYGGHPLATADDIVDTWVSLQPMRRRDPRRERHVFATVDGAEPFMPMPVSQAIPMLETALNYAVASRGHQYLILHAAVVARDDRALILVGASGSGKSTLTSALVFGGWRLLSDELTLLRTDNDTIDPLPRPISLKNESIDLIQEREQEARLGARYTGTLKGTIAYARPPTDSLAWAHRPAIPAWIAFPKYGKGTDPAIHPISPVVAFTRAIAQSPNYIRLGEVGFRSLTRLIDRVPAFSMVYDRLDDAVGMANALVGR